MNNIEIEKKFLFSYLPYGELKFNKKSVVFRKYVSIEPEVRINKREFENGQIGYHLTVKSGDLFIRNEIKIKITENEYEAISNLINKPALVMDIYEFKFDSRHVINFKICRDVGISFAEMEFESMEDYADTFPKTEKLPFLGEDVTSKKEYYVRNIWKKINNKALL